MTPKRNELEACPFCGGEAEILMLGGFKTVLHEGNDCPVDARGWSVEVWNHRTPPNEKAVAVTQPNSTIPPWSFTTGSNPNKETIERIKKLLTPPPITPPNAEQEQQEKGKSSELIAEEKPVSHFEALEQIKSLKKQIEVHCMDWAGTDTAVKEIAKPYLTEFQLNGDSHGFHDAETVVQFLVEHFKSQLQSQEERIKAAESIISKLSDALKFAMGKLDDMEQSAGATCMWKDDWEKLQQALSLSKKVPNE